MLHGTLAAGCCEWRGLRAYVVCCYRGQVGDLIEEMKVVDGLQYLEEPKNTA
jgi:hypothetical protein